jgi:hypothetical protein
VITVQGIASMTALKVDGSGVTQPVSGTVAVSNSFALDASVTGLQVAQASTTSGQRGELVQGAVTTAAPTYTTGQTDPLSLTTAGALRVDGSGVTQPVSGTVTSNQGTAAVTANAWPIKVTDGTNAVTIASLTNSKALAVEIVDGAGTQITSFGGGTQYADGTTQATPTGTIALGKNASNVVHALSLDTSGNLNVNLAAGTISGNAAASPTGAAVPASADYLGAKDGSGNLQGLLVESNTNPNLRAAIYSGANEATVTGANALKVDGSAVTQPISGTVAATQSGTWTDRIVGNAGASLDATVGAGTAPTNALIVGSQFNSTAPAPTSGQTMSLQADQAGNLRVFNGVASGTLTTISAANTNDTLNSVQNIFTNSGGDAAIVQLTPTGTLTTGAVTFEVSFDGSSWQTVTASAIMDPTSTTFAQIAVPFTPVSGTNKFFLITNNGWQGLRLKVSTAFTGTGHSVAVNYTLVSYDPVDNVIALSPSAANFNAAIKRAPDATSTFAPTSVDSTALEASHILKASAGVLYGVTGYSARTTSQFIQVHNTTTVPADTAVPIVVFFIPAGPVSFSWDAPAQFGKFFSAGITICNSTTGPAKTLGSADCWFNASLA